jgi:DNA-binding Lrp family transcriptional regulator
MYGKNMTIKITSFIRIEFGKSKNFNAEIKKIPEIIKIFSISGEFDVMLSIEVEQSEDLVEVIEKIEKISWIKEIHSHYVLAEWEK